MSRHGFPEDVIAMRVARLLEHGVNPQDVRAVAVEQLRRELAQSLAEREAAGDAPRNELRREYVDRKIMLYDGASYDASRSFEDSMHTVHEHSRSKSCKKKNPKKRVAKEFVRFADYR